MFTFVFFTCQSRNSFFKSLFIIFWILLAGLFILPSYNDNSILSYVYALIERTLVASGLVASVTWDFISNNHSIVESLSRSVGSKYFLENTNASTNLFLNGFSFYGLLGAMIVSVASGLLIALLRLIPGTGFSSLGFVSSSLFIYVWTEQSLYTSLLSSGILIVIIFLALLKIRFT